MPWGSDQDPLADHDVDFADPAAVERLVADVSARHGSVSALVMCHCESVDSSIADTTVESFDRTTR